MDPNIGVPCLYTPTAYTPLVLIAALVLYVLLLLVFKNPKVKKIINWLALISAIFLVICSFVAPALIRYLLFFEIFCPA